MKAYIIHVQYIDGRFDYVSDMTLSRYLSRNRIRRFFRPSQAKWVTVGVDPIRESGESDYVYTGQERRRPISSSPRISVL